MSEQNINQEEVLEQQEEETQKESSLEQTEPIDDGVIEVSWEEISPVVELRNMFENRREDMSHRLLAFERFKAQVLVELDNLEQRMYELAAELRHAKEIPDGVQYELKLPTSEGEKAYFIRKDV